MLLYLDDDLESELLAKLLRNDGHDVVRPHDCDTSGASDAVHLTTAIRLGRVILSGNHHDFEDLHELIRVAGGSHRGILIVRRDNDRNRDMKEAQIVRGLRNLIAINLPIEFHIHVLNHFR